MMSTNTSDTITENTVNKVTNRPKTNGIVKSRARTSFKEFALKKDLRPEVQAGFKAWLRGDMFFFDNEWEQKFNEYFNRKLEKRRI